MKSSPEWIMTDGLVEYSHALEVMDARVRAVQEGTTPELIWLLQHPPLFTLGTSAKASDVLNAGNIPVYESARGGQVTYHGPGQRVIYLVLDLSHRTKDLRAYVHNLEGWVMASLACLGVEACRREGRVGLWVPKDKTYDEKIAAIGVRVKKWVTLHGIAINVDPDLAAYGAIVPCGIHGHGVTSLKALGTCATMDDLDAALRTTFPNFF